MTPRWTSPSSRRIFYTISSTRTARKGTCAGRTASRSSSIINFPVPSGGQVHGCPFKVMDKDLLKQALDFWGCEKGA